MAFALIALVKGLHFPPPIAKSFVVVGPAQQVSRNGALIKFVVGGIAFESGHLDPGFDRLKTLDDGVPIKVEGWHDWPPDGRADIISLSMDGSAIVSKGSALSSAWLTSCVALALSAGCAWVAFFSLRRPTSLWENHRRRLLERGLGR
jgi:hypothetical protein